MEEILIGFASGLILIGLTIIGIWIKRHFGFTPEIRNVVDEAVTTAKKNVAQKRDDLIAEIERYKKSNDKGIKK
jgi:hypothetical protein